MATVSPEIAMAEAKPVGFLFGDFEPGFLMESKPPPPKKVFDRVLLKERIEAVSESFCFGERKVEEGLVGMLLVVKLLVIVWTGEVGDSTKCWLGGEVTRFSFDVSTLNDELLALFERALEGCGEPSVA